MIRKPVPPKCADCGDAYPMAVRTDPVVECFEWLCGSCLYLRENPDAAPATLPPRERRPKKLQSETLF